MIYHTIDLGRDYIGRITDFADARNSFLKDLPDHEYILYKDSDVEVSNMLHDYLVYLKPAYPWYDIRQFNYINDIYQPLQNPFYTGVLVSNNCWWEGRVHEKVYPRKPHGVIDLPLIHNHRGPSKYRPGVASRPVMIAKKLWEITAHGYR